MAETVNESLLWQPQIALHTNDITLEKEFLLYYSPLMHNFLILHLDWAMGKDKQLF